MSKFFRNMGPIEEFSARQIIFKEGQPGNSMYGVVDGEVDIVLNEEVVSTIQAGGFFGELALIDKQPRGALAIAKTDCKLVLITESRFLVLIHQNPKFAFYIMRVLSTRFRHRETELMDQFESLREKIAILAARLRTGENEKKDE